MEEFYEDIVKAYPTVVGRERKDLEKFGNIAAGYIGKHIVGKGEDAHLTTKVYLDFLKIHVILICGKRGSGKCVTGDTLVQLEDGRLLSIEELVKKREISKVLSLNQDNFKIRPSKAIDFFEREVDRIIKMKLWNGIEIKVTKEHPILTPFGWKRAEDIKEGDVIAVASYLPAEGSNDCEDEKVKLLGYILSEGTIGNTFVRFTNSSKEVVNDFIECVKKFDKNLKVVRMKSNPSTYRVVGTKLKLKENNVIHLPNGQFSKGSRLIFERNSLLNWLESFGLKNKKGGEKFIPSFIFSLSNRKIALFLRCLFIGDGSLYKKKSKGKQVYVLEYASKSRKMVEGVFYLLLRFGIFSYIREKKVKGETYYRLFVTDKESIKRFIIQIGFPGKEKLISEILADNRKYHSNFDYLPKSIWKYIREKYSKKEIGKALGYKNWKGVSTKYKYNPLKSTIRKIGEYFNDEYLLKISSPDIVWIKVVEKTTINEKTKVFDITVNDAHNFVGNGVILHNSYSAGTILEEFSFLPDEYRNKMSFIVVDPVGIYWSMKYPNEQQKNLLKEWQLEPKGLTNLKVLVPIGQLESYKKAGVPVDGTIALSLSDLTPEEILLAFKLDRLSEEGVALEKNFTKLQREKEKFDLTDLIEEIRKDEETKKEVRDALVSLLSVANEWKLIVKEGMKIEEIAEPGKITVIDVSRMRSEELRNLLVALIAREIYRLRVLARKEEEKFKISGEKLKFTFPIVWLILEEAHNFIPSDKEVASSEPIKIIAKQGREPGIGLIVITQMPNRIHQDILSQTDIVISFRLTSRDDIQALHSVAQTYMQEELEAYLNSLPRWPGAALIIDDNLEKVFTVAIRIRSSWHSGGTAAVV
jgi:intein/homing endonuclease